MTVQQALEKDLGTLPVALRASPLAEMARALAFAMDEEPGARDLASLNKELRATLAELRERSRETAKDDDPIQLSQERGPAPIPLRRTS